MFRIFIIHFIIFAPSNQQKMIRDTRISNESTSAPTTLGITFDKIEANTEPNLEKDNDPNVPQEYLNSSKILIGIVTGVASLLILLILAIFLCKRFRKRNIKLPPSLEESEYENWKSSSEMHQDNTYEPLPIVPLYEAREMVAANMKYRKDLIEPKVGLRLLPQLNHQTSISEDEESVYTYAYGVKPQ